MMIQSKTNNHLSLIIWLGALYICRDTSTGIEDSLQITLFMQNEPNFRKSQMNVNKVLTRDYEKKTLGEHGKNEPKTNPNEPNFKKAKMNVTSILTKDYENKPPIRALKKRTQFPKRQKPMQPLLMQRIMKNTAFSSSDKTKPKQTQTKPISEAKKRGEKMGRRKDDQAKIWGYQKYSTKTAKVSYGLSYREIWTAVSSVPAICAPTSQVSFRFLTFSRKAPLIFGQGNLIF